MNLKVIPKVDEKIHLTFAQIAWFISIMAAILMTWGDLSSRLARIEERQLGMEARVAANERRISAIEERNRTRGFDQTAAEELKAELKEYIRRSGH